MARTKNTKESTNQVKQQDVTDMQNKLCCCIFWIFKRECVCFAGISSMTPGGTIRVLVMASKPGSLAPMCFLVDFRKTIINIHEAIILHFVDCTD